MLGVWCWGFGVSGWWLVGGLVVGSEVGVWGLGVGGVGWWGGGSVHNSYNSVRALLSTSNV